MKYTLFFIIIFIFNSNLLIAQEKVEEKKVEIEYILFILSRSLIYMKKKKTSYALTSFYHPKEPSTSELIFK